MVSDDERGVEAIQVACPALAWCCLRFVGLLSVAHGIGRPPRSLSVRAIPVYAVLSPESVEWGTEFGGTSSAPTGTAIWRRMVGCRLTRIDSILGLLGEQGGEHSILWRSRAAGA